MTDYDDIMRVPQEWKKKGRRYAWVLDHKNMMSRMKGRNYETVKLSDTDGIHFKGDHRAGVDGLVRVGDCILMSCPEEDVQKREKSNAKRSGKAAVRGVFEEFHEAAAGQGVRSFEDNRK